MVLRKWVIPIALAIVGVFVGLHVSGLEGNGIYFQENVWVGTEQGRFEWRIMKHDAGVPAVVAELMRLSTVNPTTYRMGFLFLGSPVPGPAYIWSFGVPFIFGLLGFCSFRALLNTGRFSRAGSSRKTDRLEEELKRIDELHANGSITDEEREKMRKNVLGI